IHWRPSSCGPRAIGVLHHTPLGGKAKQSRVALNIACTVHSDRNLPLSPNRIRPAIFYGLETLRPFAREKKKGHTAQARQCFRRKWRRVNSAKKKREVSRAAMSRQHSA